MPWGEFKRLLSGLNNKTPLGNVVSIRMEEDKDTLKHFTKEQHRIRNEWRSNHLPVESMTEEEKAESTKRLQTIFAQMFG